MNFKKHLHLKGTEYHDGNTNVINTRREMQ
jgi:hypothetical protein